MSDTKVTYRCAECGSGNIGVPATLYWDDDAQDWVGNAGTEDGAFECGDCDEQTWEITDWEVAI